MKIETTNTPKKNTLEELKKLYFNDRVTIQGLKVMTGMSDGDAFRCRVYLDGKLFGTAEDQGNGGGCFVRLVSDNPKASISEQTFKKTGALMKKAEAYANSLPERHYQYKSQTEGLSLKMTLNHLVENCVIMARIERSAKRGSKTKLKFMDETCKGGQYYTWETSIFHNAAERLRPEYGEIISYQCNRQDFLLRLGDIS